MSNQKVLMLLFTYLIFLSVFYIYCLLLLSSLILLRFISLLLLFGIELKMVNINSPNIMLISSSALIFFLKEKQNKESLISVSSCECFPVFFLRQ